MEIIMSEIVQPPVDGESPLVEEDGILLVRAIFGGNVEIDRDKMSGTAVFRGTRVPIQNLFDCLEAGETIDQFLDQFPSVTRKQAVGVLEESKAQLFEHYRRFA